MSECSHQYIYGGLVNIYDGEKLLKVYEYWKCRKCGKIIAGYRSYGDTSSTHGMFKEPENDGRWILLVCHQRRDVDAYFVKPGDRIIHACSIDKKEFYITDQYKISSIEQESISGHSSFLLEEVSTGVIDISKEPATVIKSS